MQRTLERDSIPQNAPWEREEPKFAPRRERFEEDSYDAYEAPKQKSRSYPKPELKAERDDFEQDYARKPQRKSKGFSMWSFVMSRPFESVAFGAAALFTVSIFVNAVFLQSKPTVTAVNVKPVEQATALKMPLPETRFSNNPIIEQAATFQPTARVSRGSIIEDAQRELARRGFYTDAIDGKSGSRTEKAVKDFQRSVGLKATGEINEDLLFALRPSANQSKAASTNANPARSAMSDLLDNLPQQNRRLDPVVTASAAPSVKRIYYVEKSLAEMAYGPITVDGIFGEDTKSAIMKFESARNMKPRGEITDRLLKEIASVTGQPLE